MKVDFSDLFNVLEDLGSRYTTNYDPKDSWSYACYQTAPAKMEYTEGDNYIIEYAYPGHKKENVKLFREGDNLTVEIKSKDKNVKGFQTKSLKETLKFETYDINNLTASYKDGILKLVIPKKEEKKAQKIEIEF